MGHHINSKGEFDSDKFPNLPPDYVAINIKHPHNWPVIAALAEVYKDRKPEFSEDLLIRLDSLRREKNATRYHGSATNLELAIVERGEHREGRAVNKFRVEYKGVVWEASSSWSPQVAVSDNQVWVCLTNPNTGETKNVVGGSHLKLVNPT